jgi:RecA/RadA recombinase
MTATTTSKGVVIAIEKQFGNGAIMALGDEEEAEPVATIPTGSLALDMATLALHAIAEVQRGGVAASRRSWTASTRST